MIKSYRPFSTLPSYSRPQQAVSKFKTLKHCELRTSPVGTERSQTWQTLLLLVVRALFHHASSLFLSLLSVRWNSVWDVPGTQSSSKLLPEKARLLVVLTITFEKPWWTQTFMLKLLKLSQGLNNLLPDACLWP